MKRLILFALFACGIASAQVPVCAYQDNLSGPSTGGEGGNGAYIDLYGENFAGASVTVNGTSAAQTIYNSVDPTLNRSQLGIQVGSATTSTGAVVVTNSSGSCQFSTATITGLSITSGVTTFTYTGPQLLAGQLVYVNGLTSTPGEPLAARSYAVLSAGLTSSTFEVNTPAASNVTSTADSGTAGNGGFTVRSGGMYYVGSGIDTDSPGSGSAAFTCANFKAGTAGAGAGGNGSFSSPWTTTNVANVDLFTATLIATAGTGYTTASGLATTGGSGTGLTVNITASGGALTAVNIATAPTGYLLGDVITVVQSGGASGTATITGYDYKLYTSATQRTPETYYSCLTAGDTLVFLNGFSFPYGDGTQDHTSLLVGGVSGTSGNPVTLMARPGATATLGGVNTVAFGERGGVPYENVYGLTMIGGQALQGVGIDIANGLSTDPATNDRVIGNIVTCPNCSGAAAGIVAGWSPTGETNTALNGLTVLGNWVYNIGCSDVGGVTNKQFHFIYVNGNGEEIGWNKTGGTGATGGCGWNGIQMNYFAGGSIGYGYFSIHDNDVSYANGAGINLSTIDPAQGPINVYNNVVHHVGIQPASDGASNFACLSSPGFSPSAGAGTVFAYNNTFYDCAVYLNTAGTFLANSSALYICATSCGGTNQTNLTLQLNNNVFDMPNYTNIGTANPFFTGSGTSELTGSNNLFNYASSPSSTSPASSLTSLTIPTNPLFNSRTTPGPALPNLIPQNISPALNEGTSSQEAPVDFIGLTRPNPPAIGALERQQLWSGVLDPGRAIDFTGAGVTGGIPTVTTACATQPMLGGNATTNHTNLQAAINADMGGGTSCVINLPAGTYSVNGSLIFDFQGKANVVLRGAGSNSTFLVWTGITTNCNGLSSTAICIWNGDSEYVNGPGNVENWTAGYAKGTTVLTLAAHTNISVGSIIVLDQTDPVSDPGNIWSCQTNGSNGDCSQQGSGGVARAGRGEFQQVTVTGCGATTFGSACTSNSITISPGLYSPEWTSGQTPQAWYSSSLPISGVGLENFSSDFSGVTIGFGVQYHNATQDWVKGIRSINGVGSGTAAHEHILGWQSTHITVRDSYFYGSNPASEGYGVAPSSVSADWLTENNIFQHIATGTITQGCVGCVFGYNYAVDNYFGGDFQQQDGFHHSVGDAFNLWEGHEGIGWNADTIHGSSWMITHFRDYLNGRDPSLASGMAKTEGTFAYFNFAFSRYFNLVGSVLGTQSYHTHYLTVPSNSTDCGVGAAKTSVLVLGFSDQNGTAYSAACLGTAFDIPNDLSVITNTMLWGNYAACTGDAACNAVRFQTSENASTAPVYPGLVAPSLTLPQSFYLSGTPSFWHFPSGTSATPWPAVGPDVTGGNISSVGGHAYHNPAGNCYLNVMGGLTDGSSGALTFDPNSCYVAIIPAAPVSLSGAVNISGKVVFK